MGRVRGFIPRPVASLTPALSRREREKEAPELAGAMIQYGK
jgi:hypothetical protein